MAKPGALRLSLSGRGVSLQQRRVASQLVLSDAQRDLGDRLRAPHVVRALVDRVGEVQADARGALTKTFPEPANLPPLVFVLGSMVANAQLVAHTIPHELRTRRASGALRTFALVGHEDRAGAAQARPLAGLPLDRHLERPLFVTDHVRG